MNTRAVEIAAKAPVQMIVTGRADGSVLDKDQEHRQGHTIAPYLRERKYEARIDDFAEIRGRRRHRGVTACSLAKRRKIAWR
jgi:hypothetical protein